MLTLFIYRHGSDQPDVCEFEDRREYLAAEREMRRIIRWHRRRKERPIYGTPIMTLPGVNPQVVLYPSSTGRISHHG